MHLSAWPLLRFTVTSFYLEQYHLVTYTILHSHISDTCRVYTFSPYNARLAPRILY